MVKLRSDINISKTEKPVSDRTKGLMSIRLTVLLVCYFHYKYNTLIHIRRSDQLFSSLLMSLYTGYLGSPMLDKRVLLQNNTRRHLRMC